MTYALVAGDDSLVGCCKLLYECWAVDGDPVADCEVGDEVVVG